MAVMLLAPPVTASDDNDNEYAVTLLVSNNGVPGTVVDPNLINAWGLVAGPTSPWWVANNGADLSTLYNAAGSKLALQVGVAGGPTGVVFNGASGSFLVAPNAPARFIFSTLGGKIAGWNPTTGATAVVKVDASSSGAVYTGLAIATTTTDSWLFAANFAHARVDVFDSAWGAVTTSGGFVDSKIPNGYAPFGIQTVGARIVVAYAKVGPGGDEQAGRGLGFVDAFDTSGNLLARVARHGRLNAPWGIALAPANFGRFGGDLLIGNFGDGRINAYREMPNGHFRPDGQLRGDDDRPIVIDGLWALQFGHGAANNGPTDSLFFTAGPNGETDGLFGFIRAVPGQIEDNDEA